ncbi:MAG: hypothetical protein ABI682_01845 [Acidobacteriota bacterium]
MAIALAVEGPEIQHKSQRANFRWTLAAPWDEQRLAAFLMVKHRRNDADWTRRSSPFFASLGQDTVECSVPITGPDALPDLEKLLTRELVGILTGASRIHDEMESGSDWRRVTPP